MIKTRAYSNVLLHLNDKKTLFAEVNTNQLKNDKVMPSSLNKLKRNINQIKGSEKLKMA